MPIDLLRELPRARLAPVAEAADRIEIAVVDHRGSPRPALVMRAPSRVIWEIQMRDRAKMRVDVARFGSGEPSADLSIRLGVSDDRVYEDLFQGRFDPPPGAEPEWQALSLDLSLYSGRHWSLFHQPARRVWLLVLNVQGGDGASAAFVEPRIVAR